MSIDDNFAETIVRNASLPVIRIGSERHYVSMYELVKISLKKKLPEGGFKLEIYAKDRFGNKYYSSGVYNKHSIFSHISTIREFDRHPFLAIFKK